MKIQGLLRLEFIRLLFSAIAETTTIEDRLSDKETVLEEMDLGLLTGFEEETTWEDKKSLTVFPP